VLISKKDLLVETGISYGQLYRWKRMGLIPDSWFIKQSTFTGQETFFPKTKILKRIRAIQELRDKYTLEELAKILSPEVAERNFTTDDLAIIEEIQQGLIPAFVKGFGKNTFTYIEVLFLIAISELKQEEGLSIDDVVGLVKGIKDYCNEIKSTGYVFVLFDRENNYYATIYQEQAEVFFDSRMTIVKQIRINEISSRMKLKYRKSFNFRFDDEVEDINDNSFEFSY
jgi:DNA-binding transcriptional MerR regulator